MKTHAQRTQQIRRLHDAYFIRFECATKIVSIQCSRTKWLVCAVRSNYAIIKWLSHFFRQFLHTTTASDHSVPFIYASCSPHTRLHVCVVVSCLMQAYRNMGSKVEWNIKEEKLRKQKLRWMNIERKTNKIRVCARLCSSERVPLTVTHFRFSGGWRKGAFLWFFCFVQMHIFLNDSSGVRPTGHLSVDFHFRTRISRGSFFRLLVFDRNGKK